MKKQLVALSVSLALIGCNDDTSQADPTNVSGKVIDGYISGASVFLDVNFNSEHDAGEPIAVTANNGSFNLSIPDRLQQCAANVPLVVDVPVGAVDQDFGPVSEAYKMALPPAFDAFDAADEFSITPLTSVLWNDARALLKESISDYNCDSIADSQSRRESLKGLVEHSLSRMTTHYNMSAEQLFSDFIALDDQDTHTKAVGIVKGLKKSLAESIALKEANPDAQWVSVNYHQFDSRDFEDEYPTAWYREEYIVGQDTSSFLLSKVSDSLDSITKVIIDERTFSEVHGDAVYTESIGFESRDGDASAYQCDVKEIISFSSDEKRYELVNTVSRSSANYAGCEVTDFAQETEYRNKLISYSEDNTEYSTQYTYWRDQGAFPDLNSWIDLKESFASLDYSELVSSVEALPYLFDNAVDSSAVSWDKQKHYMDGTNKIMERYTDYDGWTKQVTAEDGTYTRQCSADGASWLDCVE